MSKDPFPIVSPRAAGLHQKLLDYADDHGRQVDELRDVLWLTMSHSYLLAMGPVVRQLLKSFETMPANWQPTASRLGIDSWPTHLKWLDDSENALKWRTAEQYIEEKNRAANTVLSRHGFKTNPMYAAFAKMGVHISLHRDGELAIDDRLRHLFRHVLFAQVMLLRRSTNRYEFETTSPKTFEESLVRQIYNACLTLRDCLSGSNTIKRVPSDLPPLAFAQWAEPKLGKEYLHDHFLYPILRFLVNAWSPSRTPVSGRSGGGHRGRGHNNWMRNVVDIGAGAQRTSVNSTDGDDTRYDWGTIDLVELRSESGISPLEAEDLDVEPSDFEAADAVVLSDFKCDETRRDVGALARAARAKGRHVLLSNQLFPWEYTGLTIGEVAEFLSTASRELRALRDQERWTPEQWIQAEAMTAALIVFWLGAEIERVTEMHWLPDESLLHGEKQDKYDLAYVGDAEQGRGQWYMCAVSPLYQTTPEVNPEQLRPAAAYLRLPDLPNLGYFIASLKSHPRPPRPGSYPDRLLITDVTTLQRAVKTWLKERFPGDRITLAKLTGYLPRELSAATGDATQATMITGNVHRLARVRLFYTSTRTERLANIYRSVIESLLDRAYGAIGRDNVFPPSRLRLRPQGGVVGGRNCPTSEAVQSMFARLHRDITEASTYVDRTGFVRYHNLLTLWTLQGFAYATSCRAIVTPLLPLDEIDERTGLAPLSDKDDEFSHKTRLVWIPEPIRRQLRAYQRHLQMVEPQMRGWRAKRPYPIAYFLDPDGAFEEARPKVVERELRAYLLVKPNTHRRFLRTELVERGCAPEAVDAFMGHWQVGEEPFGRFSSFTYEGYIAELKQYLLPLLAELGITRLISSRLAC